MKARFIDHIRRTTFDGAPLIGCFVDGRADLWVPGAEFLGSCSAVVASLFLGEACITDRANLPALLADCRAAQGQAARLHEIRTRRAQRAKAAEFRRRATLDARNHAAWCACWSCGKGGRGVIASAPRMKPRHTWRVNA